jgi:hypothetical protein
MNAVTLQAHVRAWRALPEAEKTRRRRATVVDEVVGSMQMEREPVSSGWERQARSAQRARLAR